MLNSKMYPNDLEKMENKMKEDLVKNEKELRTYKMEKFNSNSTDDRMRTVYDWTREKRGRRPRNYNQSKTRQGEKVPLTNTDADSCDYA